MIVKFELMTMFLFSILKVVLIIVLIYTLGGMSLNVINTFWGGTFAFFLT